MVLQARDFDTTVESQEETTQPPAKSLIDIPEPPQGDRRTGDNTIYWYYIRMVGRKRVLFFAGLLILYTFCAIYPTYWVTQWTNDNDRNSVLFQNGTIDRTQLNQRLGLSLGIYFGLVFGSIAFLTGALWYLMVSIAERAARLLHKGLLKTALDAPLSFYSKTDTGTTANRFAQDLQLCDMELPLAILNTVLTFFMVLGGLIAVAAVTGYLAAVIPGCLAAFYFIQRFYLRTSRQLRLMEIEAKSPLFSHFIETLSGLATIRAFGWQRQYKEKNQQLLEASQKPFYLLFCVQRWLELVVGLVVAGLATLLVGVVVALKANGKDLYFPQNPPSIGSPLAEDCAISLGSPGNTTTVTVRRWDPHISEISC